VSKKTGSTSTHDLDPIADASLSQAPKIIFQKISLSLVFSLVVINSFFNTKFNTSPCKTGQRERREILCITVVVL
jgi:hypothetical protein